MNWLKTKQELLFGRDPWLVFKYVSVAIFLGVIGKFMLYYGKETSNLPPMYAQFIPTLPMMTMYFLTQRYLWRSRDIGFWSYVAGCWTMVYGTQFIITHGMFALCTQVYGWNYIVVSSVIGIIATGVTYTLNELKIFGKRLRQQKINPA